MIYEAATLAITPGSEAAFEEAVAQAVPLFQQAPGALSFRLERSVEDPLEYTLLVGWASVEHHMVGFRSSDAFARWRELVGPYFAKAPVVKHLHTVHVGF